MNADDCANEPIGGLKNWLKSPFLGQNGPFLAQSRPVSDQIFW